MGIAVILFNGTEPFDQIIIILSTEDPMWNLMKVIQEVWEKKTLKDFTFLYMFIAQGQGQIIHEIWWYLNSFTSLIMHCKFQPLVLNTYWENDFSTFSPYKCMRAQIWPCCKKDKGQPMTIIWTSLVDLESPMVYSKTQPQSFLGSGEEDFLGLLPYIGMAAILFRCRTIRTNCQYPLDSGPHVKSGENSQAVSEKKIFKKFYTCI